MTKKLLQRAPREIASNFVLIYLQYLAIKQYSNKIFIILFQEFSYYGRRVRSPFHLLISCFKYAQKRMDSVVMSRVIEKLFPITLDGVKVGNDFSQERAHEKSSDFIGCQITVIESSLHIYI